jgi:hypothetical protein
MKVASYRAGNAITELSRRSPNVNQGQQCLIKHRLAHYFIALITRRVVLSYEAMHGCTVQTIQAQLCLLADAVALAQPLCASATDCLHSGKNYGKKSDIAGYFKL